MVALFALFVVQPDPDALLLVFAARKRPGEVRVRVAGVGAAHARSHRLQPCAALAVRNTLRKRRRAVRHDALRVARALEPRRARERDGSAQVGGDECERNGSRAHGWLIFCGGGGAGERVSHESVVQSALGCRGARGLDHQQITSRIMSSASSEVLENHNHGSSRSWCVGRSLQRRSPSPNSSVARVSFE